MTELKLIFSVLVLFYLYLNKEDFHLKEHITNVLARAANRVYASHKITQLLDPEKEGERIVAQGFLKAMIPADYACLGDKCH